MDDEELDEEIEYSEDEDELRRYSDELDEEEEEEVVEEEEIEEESSYDDEMFNTTLTKVNTYLTNIDKDGKIAKLEKKNE